MSRLNFRICCGVARRRSWPRRHGVCEGLRGFRTFFSIRLVRAALDDGFRHQLRPNLGPLMLDLCGKPLLFFFVGCKE